MPQIHKPKIEEKLFFFFAGAIMSFPFPALANSLFSYFLLLDLPRISAILISTVLIAPLIEEFAKIYPMFYRHGESRRSLFSLAFLTGLGFGLIEFFLYVFAYAAPWEIRLPLILFHATNTAIVGFGVGKNRSLIYYLFAVILHALYNFSIQAGGTLTFISIATIGFSYAVALFLSIRLRRQEAILSS